MTYAGSQPTKPRSREWKLGKSAGPFCGQGEGTTKLYMTLTKSNLEKLRQKTSAQNTFPLGGGHIKEEGRTLFQAHRLQNRASKKEGGKPRRTAGKTRSRRRGRRGRQPGQGGEDELPLSDARSLIHQETTRTSSKDSRGLKEGKLPKNPTLTRGRSHGILSGGTGGDNATKGKNEATGKGGIGRENIGKGGKGISVRMGKA